MIWFTADEHYGHRNIIRYCDRPFNNVDEMNETLIANSNSVVRVDDLVVHAGDFCLESIIEPYAKQLRGHHVWLVGCHDRWMTSFPNLHFHEIWRKTIEGEHVVVSHWCMRTWPRSHFNAWHLYGHSHGRLDPVGKSWDIGVDNNEFKPVSFDQIKEIMETRPDNPNLVQR